MTQPDNGNQDLLDLLRRGDPDDLALLVDYITDNGEGRISLASDTCRFLTHARETGDYSGLIPELIAREIRSFGGNTILNLFRSGEGVPYREVVVDVAEHLKAIVADEDSIETLEIKILGRLTEHAWQRMSDDEKRELGSNLGVRDGVGPAALAAILAAVRLGGPASYRMAMLAANAVARSLAGRGLSIAANAGLTRTIGVLAGPLGWVVTAVWAAFDLASPAYRVTVPCVIQLAYMRHKHAGNLCPACQSLNQPGAKFCSECGQRLRDKPDTAAEPQAGAAGDVTGG